MGDGGDPGQRVIRESTVCLVHQADPGVAQKLFDDNTEINADADH